MCGIYCHISKNAESPSDALQDALRARGPDAYGVLNIRLEELGLHIQFVSAVLALRGATVVKQPLQDEHSGSVLCWNGEAWSLKGKPVEGNDTLAVFELLNSIRSTKQSDALHMDVTKAVLRVLSLIRGPFAFVFYHAETNLLFYGRDCLGRRSLLQNISLMSGSLILSSVCGASDPSQIWSEVEADGLYVLDLAILANSPDRDSRSMGGCSTTRFKATPRHFAHAYAFPVLNRSLIEEPLAEVSASAVEELHRTLRAAVIARITDIRPHVPGSDVGEIREMPSQVAVLFSGGLDCSLLARIVHDILDSTISIDLLNVAFENPRIHKPEMGNDSVYELCPDRITARKSHAELQRICPGRQWNLVEIDVPYTKTLQHRQAVIDLMHPHNTEMDLSIAIALYFAARGIGIVANSSGQQHAYSSSARVLLSGLGADELFGGYQRHGTAYARHGFTGLLDELQLDISRLGKRNLGRDDRVISHWGKEVRFPYLDEDLVSGALDAPVWEKCGFGLGSDGGGCGSCLDPEKRVLRLLANKLGLVGVAAEKKRAIQFGTRSAKMETGKVKGTQLLS